MALLDGLAVLRFVHVAVAVVAMGTNLTFPLWVRAAEREPEHLAFALERIRWLDRNVAIPGYALAAVTGIALALLGGIPLTRGWLALAIALYVAVAALGFGVYAPLSRDRLAALRRGGATDAAYLRARAVARWLDAIVIAAVLVILALMVTKPF